MINVFKKMVLPKKAAHVMCGTFLHNLLNKARTKPIFHVRLPKRRLAFHDHLVRKCSVTSQVRAADRAHCTRHNKARETNNDLAEEHRKASKHQIPFSAVGGRPSPMSAERNITRTV